EFNPRMDPALSLSLNGRVVIRRFCPPKDPIHIPRCRSSRSAPPAFRVSPETHAHDVGAVPLRPYRRLITIGGAGLLLNAHRHILTAESTSKYPKTKDAGMANKYSARGGSGVHFGVGANSR